MPDRRTMLIAVAEDLRRQRTQIENANDGPFDAELAQAAIDLAAVTDRLRAIAERPAPATTHHFGANA